MILFFFNVANVPHYASVTITIPITCNVYRNLPRFTILASLAPVKENYS